MPGIVINAQQLGFRLSQNVLANIFAESITAFGVVNTDYQGDVEGNASVYVIKQDRYDGTVRELGDSVNGGWEDNTGLYETSSTMYQLDIKYVYNKGVSVPALLMQSLPYDIDTIYTDQIVKSFAEFVDKVTLGTLVSEALGFTVTESNPEFGVTPGYHYLEVDPTSATAGEDYYEALQEANVRLTMGNTLRGDTTCPKSDRTAMMSPDFKAKLLTKKGIILNSDLGSMQIASNEFTEGKISGLRVIEAPQAILQAIVIKKAGTTQTMKSGTGIQAIVLHPMGTTRATDFSGGVEVVRKTTYQGINLLPSYRFGVASFRPWMIVIIGTQAFYDAYKSLGATPSSIALAKTPAGNMAVGGVANMVPTIKNAAADVLSGFQVQYTSSQPGYVTVNSAGKLTAIGAGTSIITGTVVGYPTVSSTLSVVVA